MAYRLTIRKGMGVGTSFNILYGRTYTVGRGLSCDIILKDSDVSRAHCGIHTDGESLFIADLQSLNGTIVNGERVSSRSLAAGDVIRLGNTFFEISPLSNDSTHKEESADSATPPECADAATASEQADAHTGEICPGYNAVYVEQETTIRNFLRKHPKDSANKVFRWWQIVYYVLILAAIVVLFDRDWLRGLHVLHLLCAVYLVIAAYKLVIVMISTFGPGEIRIKQDDVGALVPAELPVYTVLVPLYKEEAVVEKIIRSVNALDYPQDKLDVKVLLEPDDHETIGALCQAELPECVELVVVPDSQPKTKPKACNHGLARARGEFLVIFDAEDRPDPDQLKKAVLAFREAGKKTICMQAKLNYYNPLQNLLTRWFTVEYSTWFDLYLPGLHTLGAPIPLGGTSNHFRTSVLKEIGGWDPFNVTEDCDLGIRLHKIGYKTEVFDSTTWEEANSRLGNWVRQRSRWVKGYIQTHLVHMRNPFKALWQLRPWGFSNFIASVGGLSLMLLLNPFFWMMGLIYLGLWGVDLHNNNWSISQVMELEEALKSEGGLKRVLTLSPEPGERLSWQMLFTKLPPDPDLHSKALLENRISQVFWVMTLALTLTNFFFIATHVIACVRRRMFGLIPYALLCPFYWVLISIGAWKGFLQLFVKPFYWEKTVHGLDDLAATPGAAGEPLPSVAARGE